jgi:hypothetical protein
MFWIADDCVPLRSTHGFEAKSSEEILQSAFRIQSDGHIIVGKHSWQFNWIGAKLKKSTSKVDIQTT